MRHILLSLLLTATLVLALSGSSLALVVPVAPAGQLPDQGISIATGELGNPSAIDSVSFFSSPPDIIMTSTLYPISPGSCGEKKAKRTIAVRPGEYCIVVDDLAYRFVLTDISEDSIDVNGAGDGTPFTYSDKSDATIDDTTPDQTTTLDDATTNDNTLTSANTVTGMASLDAAADADAGDSNILADILPITIIIMIACLAVFLTWWLR